LHATLCVLAMAYVCLCVYCFKMAAWSESLFCIPESRDIMLLCVSEKIGYLQK